jgi:hypothetical protein
VGGAPSKSRFTRGGQLVSRSPHKKAAGACNHFIHDSSTPCGLPYNPPAIWFDALMRGSSKSKSYRFYMICDRTNVGLYDQALDRFFVDMEELLRQAAPESRYEEARTAMRTYFARLPDRDPAARRFLGSAS